MSQLKLTPCEITVDRDFLQRTLAVLETLDDALSTDGHQIVSNDECAQYEHWNKSADSSQDVECDCELGAVILGLSNLLGRSSVRYREPGKRFGELPERCATWGRF